MRTRARPLRTEQARRTRRTPRARARASAPLPPSTHLQRLVAQALADHVERERVERRQALLEVLGLGDFGQLDAREERVAAHELRHARREVAEAAHDLEELVDVALAREERQAVADLGHEAADGPHVDGLAVGRVADQQLRAAVPARADVVRVASARPGEEARKAEVAQLQDAVLREEQVLGLEVAVDDRVAVQVVDAADQLPHDAPHLARLEALRVALERLEQRALDVLEDEVELALAAEHLDEAHDVLVPQLLEDAHLAQRRLAHLLVLVALLELLDGHDLARLAVPRLEHDAVRALADRAVLRVGLHRSRRRRRRRPTPRAGAGTRARNGDWI